MSIGTASIDRSHILHGVGILSIGLDIGDVHCSPFEGSARGNAVSPQGNRVPIYKLSKLRTNIVVCDRPEELAIEPKDEGPLGLAQPDSAFSYCVKHWL